MDTNYDVLILAIGICIVVCLLATTIFHIWMEYKDHDIPRKYWYDAWRKCNGERSAIERENSILERKQQFHEQKNKSNEESE